MAASAGPWDKRFLTEDALATQRKYHLSQLAEEETEAWRNENCIMNGAGVSTGAGVCACVREEVAWIGRRLYPCPTDQVMWAAASSIYG